MGILWLLNAAYLCVQSRRTVIGARAAEAEEEHKKKNEAKANKYTQDLEQALFDNFAEVAAGKVVRSAGAKYK